MKKFIKKLVADVKFADAGTGQRLNEEKTPKPGPSSAPVPASRRPPSADAQSAGAAALARLEAASNKGNKQNSAMRAQQLELKKQMQRQVSEERTSASMSAPREPEVIPQVGLKMVCPICGASTPKPQMSAHFESCLEKELELKPLETTCTMIYTLNKDEEKLAIGVKTLAFFVQNVVKAPDEEKYKKIRVSNGGVQKKIMPLVGGVEFLEIAGFSRITDDNDGEEYFIMLDTPTIEHLTLCIETLQNSKKASPTLDRDTKVLQSSAGLQRYELSTDFYRVTKEDLMAEQKRRAEESERGDLMRTKAMRDKDAGVGMRIYHYSLIRVRFPDGLYLQGTFSAHDTVESVFKFVESSLRHPISFTLITPGLPALKRDSTLLKAAGLVPSGVLNLSTSDRTEFTLLSDELVCKLSDL